MTSKMVIRQPQPMMDSTQSDEWNAGICRCCDDMPGCCFGFWCCPCLACMVADDYGECLCLPLLNIFGCIPVATMAIRVSMRQRYGIKDTMCRDCALSFFCQPCAWCQMSKEMKRRKIQVVLVGARAPR